MKLLELFDPKKINEPKTRQHQFEVEQEVGGRNFVFIAMSDVDEDDVWRIDFAEHLDTDTDEPFVNDKTGKGKEFEVFSFVVACAKELVKRKDPRVMRLRAVKSEPNRAKLYARLAKKFGTGFKITQETNDRYITTVMTKID